MKLKPKVTIIIPTYNNEKEIDLTIKSVLNQTFTNFELIIINDGSQDNTKNLVIYYCNKDNRIKLYNQKNQGVSVARNKGLSYAQGKYICFLDSDDYYESTFIEKLLFEIDKKQADVSYCGYNVISSKGKRKKQTNFMSSNLLIDYILGKVSIHTTGWMIKKQLIDSNDIKFIPGVSWGEDIEFFCRILAESKKTVYVKEYLTNYRVDIESEKLSTFSMDKLDKDFESIQRILNNNKINTNYLVEQALVEYRLPALLIYKLLLAIELGINDEIILTYYNKYNNYFNTTKWINGLRSLKLNISRIKLFNKVNSIRKVNNS